MRNKKSKGLIVYNIKFDQLARYVGEKLEKSKPDNVEVIRYLHPEYSKDEDYFFKFIKPWTKELIKQHDVDFTLELQDMPLDYSEKHYLEHHDALHSIELLTAVFPLNKELRKVVEKHRTIFNRQFYPHRAYILASNLDAVNFDHMIITLFHHPLFVIKDEAVAIVKNLSDYLVKNYYRRRK